MLAVFWLNDDDDDDDHDDHDDDGWVCVNTREQSLWCLIIFKFMCVTTRSILL